MSVVDTAWLRMDSPENLMVINGVFLFEEDYSKAKLEDLIGERLLKIDRFRAKPVTDGKRYFWEEMPEIDMDYHVSSGVLPDSENPEKALQQFAGDLTSVPLDPAKPLWRFYHIDGYKSGAAVVFKIHHSYADGMALITVMDAIADKSVMHSSPAANIKFPQRKPSSNTALGKLQFMLESAALNVGFGLAWLYEALKVAFLTADSKTSYKQPLSTQKKVVWAPSLDVQEVKQVGKALGCTMNDVLLACVAGSLRRYLTAKGEQVEGVKLRATVPVNLRPLSEAMNLGNEFGLVYLDLPVGEQDAIERVYKVKSSMSKLKNGIQAKMSYGVLSILGFFPTAAQRFALNFFSSKASAVMTNVPGPSEPVYFEGVKLSKPMFWVPQSGEIGIGVSILSYDGKVEFGLIADTALVSDPHAVIDGFMEDFQHLKSKVMKDVVQADSEIAAIS